MRLIKIILFTLLAYNGYSQNIGIRQMRGLQGSLNAKYSSVSPLSNGFILNKQNGGADTIIINIPDTTGMRLRPIAGTNMTITGTYPNLTFNSTATGGGSGTVTGGSITWPGTIYSSTTTGTVTSGSLSFSPTLNTQTANTFLSGPVTGSTANPTFRALVAADFPNLTIPIGSINATGTPSATTYLRGDGTWGTPAGGGTSGLSTTFGTAGSVLFRGTSGISQSNSNFYFDSANVRLGLGKIPTSILDIVSTGAIETINHRNTNTAGYEGLNLYDDNNILSAAFAHSNSTATKLPASTYAASRKYGEPLYLAINTSNSDALFLAQKVTILSPSGLVGINNLTPTEQLHIKGKLKIDTIPDGTSTDSVAVIRNGVIYKVSTVVASGSSQWTTSGSDIFYNTGQVRISPSGTTNSQLRVNALEVQSYAVNNAWIGDNTYFNGTNFIRRASGYSGFFYFASGEGQFRFGATGAAGSTVNEGGNGTVGKVVFKANLDGSVGLGGSISNAAGNYTGATAVVNSTGIIYYTTTSPATPAAGTVVEWWDGTNKRWKKSDGTTGIIY